MKLVECWIGSGTLKENPEDVASAVFGPCWLNEKPVEGDGLASVAGWPNVGPVVVFSAGFVAGNKNPPFILSEAFLLVPKANPPLAPWLEGWFCCNVKPLPEFPPNGEGNGDPKPVPVLGPKEKPGLELPGICNCGSDCGLALPPLMSIPPPRVGLSSIRMPSSAGGGVEERAGVVTPNENGGFVASVDAGVPKEKPPVLTVGLVSDCVAGEPNESPVGPLAGTVVEEPNVNPLDVIAGFSTVEGVVEEAPNVNTFLAEVEGGAVAFSLAGWLKEKGVDNLARLGASVGCADSDTDTGINEGLGAREKPGFNGPTLSTATGFVTFEKEKGAVEGSAGFVLGADADTGVPKPGNADVAPTNKGLGGATPASSFFSDGCCADEGVRLNGSAVVVVGCVDDGNVGGAGGVGPKLNGARDGA